MSGVKFLPALGELVSPQLIYRLAVVVLVAVLLANVVGLLGRQVYFELATHFRVQYALAALACLVTLIAFRSWRLAPLAAAALVFNLVYILPYYLTPPAKGREPHSTRLRLLHANVLGSNKNYPALIEAVRRESPDVIVLQEFTQKWLDETRVLAAEYPYHETAPRPGGSGMALFSRHPLEGAEVLTLDASSHLAMLARVNVGGVAVHILSLHPPTPVRTDKFVNRNRQFAEAASLLRRLEGPRVLIGDLNTTMWSPYFGDLIRDSGLRDGRLGFGLMPSWPVPLPVPLQIPIDHCLVSDAVVVERIVTGRRTGSDHRPLVVDVRLKRPAS
jgi:endonuclease/exonuclease/phosphatase (EEP) superfamily protein YafD